MLDLKFIRDNVEAVRENVKSRHVSADPDLVVELYDRRNLLLKELETLRASRNANADRMKGKLPPEERAPLIEEGKRLKEKIAELESRHEETEKKLIDEALKIPNMAHPDAPIAEGETGNKQLRTWGKVPSFSFAARDHVQLGQSLDLIDFETGARVAGQKFYYLKNQAVILELALVRYALDALMREGFTPMMTPDVAREEIVAGHGFNPRGPESNIYTIEGTDLCLIATAEFTLGGYNAGKVLQAEQLPLCLAGVSHCFRSEAGAAGQFSRSVQGAPVYEGRDVRLLSPHGIRGHARAADRHRGEDIPGPGDSLPDRGYVHGGSRRTRIQEVRYRGMDARTG